MDKELVLSIPSFILMVVGVSFIWFGVGYFSGLCAKYPKNDEIEIARVYLNKFKATGDEIYKAQFLKFPEDIRVSAASSRY